VADLTYNDTLQFKPYLISTIDPAPG